MGKVQLLDEKTINLIAAGEVIENPASVVKELVENSLDAGATKISIEVQGGGLSLIRVVDNGQGMEKEDVEASLNRYATSKIRNADDLFALKTMGFRGEALSSIAAVSELTIVTSPRKNSEHIQDGTEVYCHFGGTRKIRDAKVLPGTEIEVKSLFNNVPARKKFQKSHTHSGHDVIKVVTSLAMAHPYVAFEFMVNGKKEFSLSEKSPTHTKERVGDLLGSMVACEMIPINFENADCKIEGFIGLPEHSRPNKAQQYLFMNKRAIFSPAISATVKSSYATTIDQDRFPSFIIHLSILPDLVDVNVHPQKREVRFRKEAEIKFAINDAVTKALFNFSRPVIPFPVIPFEQRVSSISFETSSENEEIIHELRSLPFSIEKKDHPKEIFENLIQTTPKFQIIGIFNDYILVEIPYGSTLELPERFLNQDSTFKDGLFFIDIKAAMSRIVYEDLLEENRRDADTYQIERLLIPIILDVVPHEVPLLSKILPQLQKLGIGIKEFGRTSFAIDEIPLFIGSNNIENYIHTLLKEGVATSSNAEAINKKISNCLRFVKRERQLFNIDFSKEIVQRLFSCKMPFKCPMGLHTLALVSKEEIQKKFAL